MTTNTIIQEDLNTIYQAGIDWVKFKNCTVLVTGANGFLPAYMVETLLYLNEKENLDIKVVGLVRSIENAHQRFSEYLDSPNLKFIEQDVAMPIVTTEHFDYIIHAASQASPKYYGIDPVGTLKANVIGTINLLDFALKNQIKSFLYFSSGEVYGEADQNLVHLNETDYGYLDPVQVRSCYGESKRMGENICVSYAHQFNVPAKIVRPFHTYGPKMKLDDGRVYADFVSNVINGQDICMQSDGSAVRAFCYLTDATIGFFKVLLDGKDGEAYNVGNPSETHSILELASIVVGIFPDRKLTVVKQHANNGNGYLKSPLKRNSPDIDKIKMLNWNPVVTASEGFKRTIESYK